MGRAEAGVTKTNSWGGEGVIFENDGGNARLTGTMRLSRAIYLAGSAALFVHLSATGGKRCLDTY